MTESTSNHMKAPKSASFVARMRNVFGNAQVQVLYVKEGPVELGQPDQSTYATTYQNTVKKNPAPHIANEASEGEKA